MSRKRQNRACGGVCAALRGGRWAQPRRRRRPAQRPQRGGRSQRRLGRSSRAHVLARSRARALTCSRAHVFTCSRVHALTFPSCQHPRSERQPRRTLCAGLRTLESPRGLGPSGPRGPRSLGRGGGASNTWNHRRRDHVTSTSARPWQESPGCWKVSEASPRKPLTEAASRPAAEGGWGPRGARHTCSGRGRRAGGRLRPVVVFCRRGRGRPTEPEPRRPPLS